MKISSTKKISDLEGYYAMLYMLKNFWETTGSNDLTDILSGGECWIEDTPADIAIWDYWQEAINKVKTEGSPPLKILYKSIKDIPKK